MVASTWSTGRPSRSSRFPNTSRRLSYSARGRPLLARKTAPAARMASGPDRRSMPTAARAGPVAMAAMVSLIRSTSLTRAPRGYLSHSTTHPPSGASRLLFCALFFFSRFYHLFSFCLLYVNAYLHIVSTFSFHMYVDNCVDNVEKPALQSTPFSSNSSFVHITLHKLLQNQIIFLPADIKSLLFSQFKSYYVFFRVKIFGQVILSVL